MKTFKVLLVLPLLTLAACVGSPSPKKESLVYKASNSASCTLNNPTNYSGPIVSTLTVNCTGAGTNPVTPPVVVNPPTPIGGCSAGQLSDTTTPKLTRQCSGSITYYGGTLAPYNGQFANLTDIFSNATYRYGTWMNLYSGISAIINVNSGQYVSFAFTPTGNGSIELSNNQSWGDGGLISISKAPGQFTLGNPSVICQQDSGAGNSLIFSTVANSQCQMFAGNTYYINFADVILSTGDELCFQRPRNTCANNSSKVSYVIYTSKVQ